MKKNTSLLLISCTILGLTDFANANSVGGWYVGGSIGTTYNKGTYEKNSDAIKAKKYQNELDKLINELDEHQNELAVRRNELAELQTLINREEYHQFAENYRDYKIYEDQLKVVQQNIKDAQINGVQLEYDNYVQQLRQIQGAIQRISPELQRAARLFGVTEDYFDERVLNAYIGELNTRINQLNTQIDDKTTQIDELKNPISIQKNIALYTSSWRKNSSKVGALAHAFGGYGTLIGNTYLGIEFMLGYENANVNINENKDLKAKVNIKNSGFVYGFAPRIGYLVTPRLLAYARFGIEGRQWKVTRTFEMLNDTKSFTVNKVQFVPGLGVDFTLSSKTFMRGEYAYNFGFKKTFNDGLEKVKLNQHIFKIGFGYRFN